MSEAAAKTSVASPEPPAWSAGLFTGGLEPLADRPGVWKVAGDAGRGGRISEQFTANAASYHQRYGASDHFERLFQHTLAISGAEVAPAPLILDLGTGSGVNSVLPCLNLFPGARQVATDLSGELLAMLAANLTGTEAAERVLCVAMDATSEHVEPARFDLVTGAAILHHLEVPARGLAAAARALRPGGQAIFFEPFDGYGIMRLAYERILAEAGLRGEALEPKVDWALRGLVADIAARTMPDPKAPGFADMDDKWLFARERFEVAGRRSGFSEVRFVPHNDHETLYRDIAGTQIRLATGQDDLLLPAWALEVLDSFDRALRPPVKRLLMLEGSIVLTR